MPPLVGFAKDGERITSGHSTQQTGQGAVEIVFGPAFEYSVVLPGSCDWNFQILRVEQYIVFLSEFYSRLA